MKIVRINGSEHSKAYGDALELFATRLFRKSGNPELTVTLDEQPTMFVKNLDEIIASARTNGVRKVFECQDRSEIIKA